MTDNTENDAAMALASEFLKRTGDAIDSGDFDAFADCFALPHELGASDGTRMIETREELKTLFDGVRARVRSEGITMMSRHCVAATFRTPDLLVTTHETRLLAGHVLVEEPYVSLSTARRGADGVWRIEASAYVVGVDSRMGGVLKR